MADTRRRLLLISELVEVLKVIGINMSKQNIHDRIRRGTLPKATIHRKRTATVFNPIQVRKIVFTLAKERGIVLSEDDYSTAIEFVLSKVKNAST